MSQNPNVAIIHQAMKALGPAHPLFAALDHAAAELAVLHIRAERNRAVDADERINCEVLVAPSTVLVAGCKLSTVIESIRSRSDRAEPARLLNPSAS